MRKLPLLMLLALAPAYSQAQSSVTLYGIADAGVLYVNNSGGHQLYSVASGNEQGTRWGLRVVEDLGSGLSAVAQLENGTNIMNGAALQGGRMFGRQAWVGLSSTKLGTLTLGRQYNPMQDLLAPLQIASSTSLTAFGSHPFDNDNIGLLVRQNNTAKYMTPTIGGFRAGASYSFSNNTNFARNRAYSAALTYAMGPVTVAAGYARFMNPAVSTDGALPSDNYYSAATTPFLASAQTVQQWGAGVNYKAGNLIVGAMYTGALFENPTSGSLFSGATGSGGGAGSVRFQNAELSARYYFAPDLLASIGEAYTHATQGDGSGNYWQTSAGVQYFLSKRTDLYVNGLFMQTSSNLRAWFAYTPAPSSTDRQVAVVAGIRHKF
jgi:general bacterial porin, GBP family